MLKIAITHSIRHETLTEQLIVRRFQSVQEFLNTPQKDLELLVRTKLYLSLLFTVLSFSSWGSKGALNLFNIKGLSSLTQCGLG